MATNPFAIPTAKTNKTAYKNPFGIKESTPSESSRFGSDPTALFTPKTDRWGRSEEIDISDDNVQSFEQLQAKQPQSQNQPFQQNQVNSGFSNPFGNNSTGLDVDFSMETTPLDSKSQKQQQSSGQQNQHQQSHHFLPGQRESIRQSSQRHLQFDPINVDPDNEPPLLVELGIDLNSIKVRTISVLKFQKCDIEFLEDPDMSGPIIIGFLFGFLLLLSGKLHFGYIYGFGISCTVGIYCIMNFLSMHKEIPLYNTLSILGYCLMPLIFLAFLNVFLDLKSVVGVVSGSISILWATIAATNFFVELLSQDHQKYLVAYPIFLVYSIFALITVF